MKSKRKVSHEVTIVEFITFGFYAALVLSILWALSIVFYN